MSKAVHVPNDCESIHEWIKGKVTAALPLQSED